MEFGDATDMIVCGSKTRFVTYSSVGSTTMHGRLYLVIRKRDRKYLWHAKAIPEKEAASVSTPSESLAREILHEEKGVEAER